MYKFVVNIIWIILNLNDLTVMPLRKQQSQQSWWPVQNKIFSYQHAQIIYIHKLYACRNWVTVRTQIICACTYINYMHTSIKYINKLCTRSYTNYICKQIEYIHKLYTQANWIQLHSQTIYVRILNAYTNYIHTQIISMYIHKLYTRANWLYSQTKYMYTNHMHTYRRPNFLNWLTLFSGYLQICSCV